MLLRRWFARAYHQPPNHPLFDEQPLAYWHTQMVADNEQEAGQLRALLDRAPPPKNPQQQAWRAQVQQRLDEIGGKVPTGDDDQLQADLAAAQRGDLPDFLKRKVGRQRPEPARG